MFVPYQPGQSHRFSDALARGASPFECSTTPLMRAQKESFRAPPLGCGAFKSLPVSRLYFARPLAVNPAPFDTESFSPRPTAKDGFFAMAYQQEFFADPPVFILAVFADCLKASAVGAPFVPGLRIFSPDPLAILCFFAKMFAYKPFFINYQQDFVLPPLL